MASDGQAWAYGLRAGQDLAIVVLNRSGQPIAPRVPVGPLGIAAGTELVDALSANRTTVANGGVVVQVDGRSSAVLVLP
jgi:hypothetical protein